MNILSLFIKRRVLFVSVLAVLVLALSACGGSGNNNTPPAPSSTDKPASPGDTAAPKAETKTDTTGAFNSEKKPVTFIAPAAPGSGWDLTARSLTETFQKEKLIDFPVPVQNQPGATGAVSLSQLITQHKGASDIVSVTSLPIMSNQLRGDSKYGYKDVTMIARLMTEYYMVVVPKDSPYKTLKDLMAAIAKDPGSIAVGASGDDRLPFALLVDGSGGDPQKINFISYEGGGEQTTALLNGDIKAAMAGVSEFRGQIEAGNFVGLAVLSDERLGDPVADVPTAKEAGVDVSLGNWRGVMGPPDMPENAVKFWQDTIEKALKTDTWKGLAEKNQWATTFMKGDEFQQYLDKTNTAIENGLKKTGQIK